MIKAAITIAGILLAHQCMAQPTKEEISKHHIRKALERTVEPDRSFENIRWYDHKGYDSVQILFNERYEYTNTFKNGKLVEKSVLRSGGKSDTHTYTYNTDGSYKVAEVDGGYGMTSYEWYNAKGKLMKSQSPDGNTITYKYDAKGRLLSVISDGKNYGIKVNHRYTYNTKGQLIKLERDTDGNKTLATYVYDAKGLLISSHERNITDDQPFDSKSTYQYNDKKLLTKTISKNGKYTMIYEYEYEYY